MNQKNLLNMIYYDFLEQDAKKDANKPFLVSDSETISFGSAKNIVDSLAYQLHSFGVKKGDIVALSAFRDMRIVLLELALSLLGAVTCLVDYHKAAEDIIKESNAEIKLDDVIFSENGRWVIHASGKSYILSLSHSMFLSPEWIESLKKENDPLAPSLIVFTSGSCGKRKAVILSQQNYLVDFLPGTDFYEREDDLSISVLPMHHIFALAISIAAIISFHGIYFPSFVNPGFVLRRAEEKKVTLFYGVPSYYLSLAAESNQQQKKLSHVRYGIIAAGPATYDQLCHIEDTLGFPLTPVYGMSEAFGLTTISYQEPREKRYLGVGKVMPYDEVVILNQKGNPLPLSKEGEICVKGKSLMIGYYLKPGKIDTMRDDNGYYHTGDLGYFTSDGILMLSGRLKDIIIKGGENISARKIEIALESLPYVLSSCAVGVKDKYYGEIPCAVVVLKEKNRNITASMLKEDVAALLQKNEVPKEIRILDSMPLTSTGKTDKQRVRMLFHD